MAKQTNQWLIPVVLAAGAAIALWYYWARMPVADQPQPAVVQPAVEPAEPAAGPSHPVEPAPREQAEAANLVPLPSLDQSDAYFKLEIGHLFGGTLEAMLAESGVIEKVVTTIDNLPRSSVAENVRPVGQLATPFLVDGQDASGEYTINAGNYDRYDELVGLLTSADPADIAALYRRYYPLFQKAYVNLGYPQGYFNDRLVEVIDHLLATPDVTGPLELVRPHVLYEFRDPQLEDLSSGQKLMLRLGPAHAAELKKVLRELRNNVTSM